MAPSSLPPPSHHPPPPPVQSHHYDDKLILLGDETHLLISQWLGQMQRVMAIGVGQGEQGLLRSQPTIHLWQWWDSPVVTGVPSGVQKWAHIRYFQ